MNTLKTGLLLTALTGLFVWIGQMAGGTGGMLIAFGVAGVMNVGSYWFSDKIVLRAVRAQVVGRQDAPELYDMTERLAKRAGLPMPKLAIVPDPSPNAFATGRNPQNAVVAVNEGLLHLLDRDEIEGVVAHELAHVKHRDTLTMAIVATVAGAVSVIANILQFAAIFGPRDEEGNSPLAALAVAMVAPLMAMLIQMGVSRAREYEADRLAAEMVGTGRGLRDALLRLERGVAAVPGHMPAQAAHMCIVNPFAGLGGVAGLFSTHPPVAERVRRLDELESRSANMAA
jgi:heat shock protein HtpX